MTTTNDESDILAAQQSDSECATQFMHLLSDSEDEDDSQHETSDLLTAQQTNTENKRQSMRIYESANVDNFYDSTEGEDNKHETFDLLTALQSDPETSSQFMQICSSSDDNDSFGDDGADLEDLSLDSDEAVFDDIFEGSNCSETDELMLLDELECSESRDTQVESVVEEMILANEADEQEEEEEKEGESEDGSNSEEDYTDDRNSEAISRLEDLALSILSQLTLATAEENPCVNNMDVDGSSKARRSQSRKRRITLELVQRRGDVSNEGWAHHGLDILANTEQPNPSFSKTRLIQFPTKARNGAKSLAQALRIIDLSHESLTNDTPVTKRDLYYRDVPLFKRQAAVDGLVDDIAATLSLGRGDLNIRASSKGLFCGSGLTLHLRHGGVVAGDDMKSQASLIPVAEDIVNIEMNENTAWVLIVEKDAVFQTLCSLDFTKHSGLAGPGIIITGKGYPDLATRQLVKALSDNVPETIPILALVDGDAYGIDIVYVYKYGSRSMRHERETLAAERVEWIGVRVNELDGMGIDRNALIPITPQDEKKARSMLRSRSDMPTEWRKELMRSLHTRRKAEIEVLSSISSETTHLAHDDPSAHPSFGNVSSASNFRRSQHPIAWYLTRKINECISSHT